MLFEGRIVLARHRAGSAVYHLLPGGGVNYRETIEDALKREVLEETGFTIELGRPLFISDTIDPTGRRHLINITFRATITGGSATTEPMDTRVEAVDFCDPDTLETLDLRPPLAPFIADALAEGLDATPTLYLGSLFTSPK